MDDQQQIVQEDFRLGDTSFTLLYDARTRKAPLVIWLPGPGINNEWPVIRMIGSKLVEEELAVLMLQPSKEEAFPIQSTLTTYLNDVIIVLEWLYSEDFDKGDFVNTGDITLAGMDRGGTAAIIACLEDSRIRQVVALSPWIDPMRSIEGRRDGILEIRSAIGTKIDSTPLFEEDFRLNLQRLNLQSNMAKLDKAIYLFYGEEDELSFILDMEKVYDFVGHAVMVPVHDADHALGLAAGQEEIPEVWGTLVEEIGEICR